MELERRDLNTKGCLCETETVTDGANAIESIRQDEQMSLLHRGFASPILMARLHSTIYTYFKVMIARTNRRPTQPGKFTFIVLSSTPR